MSSAKKKDVYVSNSVSLVLFLSVLLYFETHSLVLNSPSLYLLTIVSILITIFSYYFDIVYTREELIFVGSLCVLFLFSLLSAIWSEYPETTVNSAVSAFVPVLGVLILASFTQDKELLFKRVSSSIIIISTAASIYAILVYSFGNLQVVDGTRVIIVEVGGVGLSQQIYSSGISSFLGNPNNFGRLLSISVVCVLSLFYLEKIDKIWAIGFIILYSSALSLTGSRTSYLVTIITSIMFYLHYYWYKLPKNSKNITFLAYAIVPIIVIFVTIYSIKREIVFEERINIWTEGIANIQNLEYVYGVGYNNIRHTIGGSHSTYIDLFINTGIIGLGLLTISILVVYKTASEVLYKKTKKSMDTDLLAILSCCFAIFVGMTVHSLTETTILRLNIGFFLWAISGVIYISCSYDDID